jgi:hypothetical protein
MGQVFLATSTGGRLVAVKVIHADLVRDAGFVRRFHAEVNAARRVVIDAQQAAFVAQVQGIQVPSSVSVPAFQACRQH